MKHPFELANIEEEEDVTITIIKSEIIVKNKSLVDYICNKLTSTSITFTHDKKLEIFNTVVPMLAQFTTTLWEIKIYNIIKKSRPL